MIDLGCYIKALKSTWIRKIINDNDSKWLMLLKKIINTDKLINTGSSNLEICTQKTNSGKILLVLIRNFKIIQKLMIGMSMYVNLYGITKILELTNKLFFINPGMKKGLTHVIDLLDETCNFFYQWILFKRNLALKQIM